MANEANVRVALSILKRSGSTVLMDERCNGAYRTDVDGTIGPTPGDITITHVGEAISLAELTEPGWCWLKNRSADAYIQIGINDPDTSVFYPILELLPGMEYPIYLSRNLLEDYGPATGTGTGAAQNQLYAKAFNVEDLSAASAVLHVGAFQR